MNECARADRDLSSVLLVFVALRDEVNGRRRMEALDSPKKAVRDQLQKSLRHSRRTGRSSRSSQTPRQIRVKGSRAGKK
jgi:hypothetical protein